MQKGDERKEMQIHCKRRGERERGHETFLKTKKRKRRRDIYLERVM